MKKIIPFNNVLQFNTDVREITAISLEHEIKKYPDMISGTFYITGEYKMTDGQLDKEKFNFELPFDIALSNNYELDSLLVDIDDFRYDLVSDKNLKVNIDLYIDGTEVISPPIEREIYREELNIKEDIEDTRDIREITDDILSELIDIETEHEEQNEINQIKDYEETPIEEPESEETNEEVIEDIEPERINLLKDMLTTNKEDTMTEDANLNINNNNNNDNENINNNIFEPKQDEEKYVTYRVYKVLDNDTIDTILTKYNITKDMLSDYNNIETITPGDKLIIPTDEK